MATKLLILSFPLLYSKALADLIPTAPGPGETFTAGGTCTIEWNVDGSGAWTNVSIDLKSGSNDNQTVVTNVISGLDGTDPSLSPYSWTCPEVEPYSAIYFYEFTNNGDTSSAQWTTRFTIASETGNSITPPFPQQPNGDTIPWGNGQLAAGASPSTIQDSAGSAPNFQLDPMNLSRSKDQSDEKGDSGHDDDSKGDKDDSKGDKGDKGNDEDDGDNEDEDSGDDDSGEDGEDGEDDNKDTSSKGGDSKDDPGSSDAGSQQVHAQGVDSSSSVAPGSTTVSTDTKSTTTAAAAATSPAKAASPPKPPASSAAPTGVNPLPISASVPKTGSISAPVPNNGPSSAKATPTAALPTSQKKAHTSTAAVSAAAATPSAGSGQCQCPAGEKSGLKMTNGSAERQSISNWVLLPPLLVIFVVMF